MAAETRDWRAVEGRPSYQVSRDGQVRGPRGLRKPFLFRGWPRVTLHGGERPRRAAVHRLVAEAFVPGYAPGLQVNHKNGNKLDNRAENLEWVTARENTQHAIALGLQVRESRLTPQLVLEARRLHAGGMTYAALAKRYGVGRSPMRRAIKGLTWAWVTEVADG